MPIRDVKAVYNSCVCKLNHDNSILDIFGNHNRYKDLKPLAMQDKASKTVETQMQDFLTQIKNSSEKQSLSHTTKYKKKSSPFFKGLDFLMEENYKKSIFATFSRKNFFGNSESIKIFSEIWTIISISTIINVAFYHEFPPFFLLTTIAFLYIRMFFLQHTADFYLCFHNLGTPK